MTNEQVNKKPWEIITCYAVIKEDDLLENVWVAALDCVVREAGDIKLGIESKEEAAISSRTFQRAEHSRQGNNLCLNLCLEVWKKP